MDVLFVHNNFPGQYRHIARSLHEAGGCRLFAIRAKTAPGMPEVSMARYAVAPAQDPAAVHPFARRFNTEMRRAEAVIDAGLKVKGVGFDPQVVLVHPGWGENVPLRSLFPRARIVAYCEFFYGGADSDVGFDPEFSKPKATDWGRLSAWNAASLIALADAQAAVSPTAWQKSRYPEIFQPLIHAVHDGVDTDAIRPRPAAPWRHGDIAIEPGEEILTYVARNLEPYRGYHVFMRALPRILRARPKARVVIVGGDGVSYGARPREGTWKQIFLDEVKGELDLSRVHFAGLLPYEAYLGLLNHSRAHVYLTYPFVLSWSALEAMASGCLVVGSDTSPVSEAIRHGQNGLLVPFFDRDALVETVVSALAEPDRYAELRREARRTIVENYDLKRVCLPRQLAILKG
jgi:glycosyltransferase involved in cell wall biosynthesis